MCLASCNVVTVVTKIDWSVSGFFKASRRIFCLGASIVFARSLQILLLKLMSMQADPIVLCIGKDETVQPHVLAWFTFLLCGGFVTSGTDVEASCKRSMWGNTRSTMWRESGFAVACPSQDCFSSVVSRSLVQGGIRPSGGSSQRENKAAQPRGTMHFSPLSPFIPRLKFFKAIASSRN